MNYNRINILIFNWVKNILRLHGYDITHNEKANFVNTDYPSGYWAECKKAVDDYIKEKKYLFFYIE
jgi:hypothetical protein